MEFYIFLFLCNLLIPLIMLIAGYSMYKNPPKEINGLVGYRTAMSRKNKDTWAFAHNYCGKLWMKSGGILLIPTVIAQIPFTSYATQNCVLLCYNLQASCSPSAYKKSNQSFQTDCSFLAFYFVTI